ncbi:MAG TPA: T9SS type A sorting domain-containing protein [Ignavibacteria bacterium]|jgi:hypothetical protein
MKEKKIFKLFAMLPILFIIAFAFYDEGNKNNISENDMISFNTLDANIIKAWYRNNGSFNHNYITDGPGFEVPKGSGSHVRFISGIWIGARVLGDTIVSKSDYISDFQPGYTDNNGLPHGKDDPQFRVYKLTYGIKNKDRTQWPNVLLGNSDQGAPVYFDVISNKWKAFDYGHQTMFYCFTDSYGNNALKADVKMLNYAFDLNGPAAQAIFSKIKIINRSNNVWNDIYISVWTNDNIGAPTDDMIAGDSALQYGYTYNSRPSDPEYGTPPAVSFEMLKGADEYTGNMQDSTFVCEGLDKKIKLGYRNKRMTVFNGGTINDFNPANRIEAYRLMSGLNQDGSPIIHPSGYITKFKRFYDAKDYRFLISTGPVNINPGDTQTIVISQIYARGSSNLGTIMTLRVYSDLIRRIYEECILGLPPIQEIPSAEATDFRLYQNYPNPFNPGTKIRFEIPNLSNTSMRTQLIIYDILGREVITLVNESLSAGEYEVDWNAGQYPSGMYFCKLTVRPSGFMQSLSETRKMLLIK